MIKKIKYLIVYLLLVHSFTMFGQSRETEAIKISSSDSTVGKKDKNCNSESLKIEKPNGQALLTYADNVLVSGTVFAQLSEKNIDLIKSTAESTGSNCKNGGLKIDTGKDLNNNGILDEVEVRDVKYVCDCKR